MKLFFGGQKPKATPKEAIITLRENLAMLEKREAHLQSKIDNELKAARANATKNKQAALAALKRKRLLETQIEKISGSRMTLEAQAMAIEAANVNLETMRAMEKGAEAMKTIHKDLNIDKVDQTMEDIREQMDLANEVSDAISQPQLFGAELDEDELNAELDELEQEELDKQLLDKQLFSDERAPVTLPRLPQQPQHAAPAAAAVTDDEDDELAELRESMGMAA
ncbi:ESCRT-III subunit protein snf7 [Coemansia thaxteri]|uniref:Vacuolar-sorting protein SNF7 n=1 Tax=Coemansia thaxteri TaxID=2663907 RepID=A0A9W8BIL7_9FUNG|nr:ESCRT-III subunit protein snf7 [Coemansia thaxteri]KAJ2005882.1 ESCRT-III subunit protein snf7 [Coemansia thaxteri]KAJ2473171.1 ESCRT-III subunit protein snf7 [Coemansia sp. RSA 2322]KAJ2484265.1 ESCRT-III subunit protein snf7 [Coemansia sp. RSA 2320]